MVSFTIFHGVIMFTSILAIAAFVLYIVNIVRLVQTDWDDGISVKTILRIVGIFFPVVGVVMGFVKN
jgi:hypothetical protein